MAAPVKTLPGRYAKFLAATAGNALVYAGVTWGAANRWVELATSAAVALGVMAVPNSPAKTEPPAPVITVNAAGGTADAGRQVIAAIRAHQKASASGNVTVKPPPEKALAPPAAPE